MSGFADPGPPAGADLGDQQRNRGGDGEHEPLALQEARHRQKRNRAGEQPAVVLGSGAPRGGSGDAEPDEQPEWHVGIVGEELVEDLRSCHHSRSGERNRKRSGVSVEQRPERRDEPDREPDELRTDESAVEAAHRPETERLERRQTERVRRLTVQTGA